MWFWSSSALKRFLSFFIFLLLTGLVVYPLVGGIPMESIWPFKGATIVGVSALIPVFYALSWSKLIFGKFGD